MKEITKEYDRYFKGSPLFLRCARIRHKQAYKIANDNRKFEIGNYWKRANYFWLFQASVYAGYFYVVNAKNNPFFCENPVIIVGVTCLGFLTALAWVLTNIGSKQWQENWENHVSALEDEITGPLYKTTSNEETWSVSNINKLVSLFSVIIWVLLGFFSIYKFLNHSLVYFVYILVLAFITSIFCFFGKGTFQDKDFQWFKIGKHHE